MCIQFDKYTANWCKYPTEADANFYEILKFYLFNTLCENTSSMGKSMKDYHWNKNCWGKNELRDYMLNIAELLHSEKRLSKARTIDAMSQAIQTTNLIDKFYKQCTDNTIAFYNSGKYPDIIQIFFYIRCAFAHGRFLVKNERYYMEAIDSKSYKLKARICIKEKTLLEWKKIIESGNSVFQEDLRLMNDKTNETIKQMILNCIKNGCMRKKDIVSDIREQLVITKKKIEEQFRVLIKDNIIKLNKNHGYIILKIIPEEK